MSRPLVILAEDSPNDAALARRCLERPPMDFELVIVPNGLQVMEVLRREGQHGPVAVVLDMHMPILDGLATLAEIRKDPHTHQLPVILFTTSSHDADVRSAYALGANSFVQKPLDPDGYRETVRQLFSFWTRCNIPQSGA